MKNIEHREKVGLWLNDQSLLGSGCEVGCAFGGYSRMVLADWKGKTYHMVDPWSAQAMDEYRERQEPAAHYEHWWNEVQVMARADARIVLHRALSTVAANEFKAHELDWVYIDGNHDYRHVLEDMDAWFFKVKPGGLMGGHDFQDKRDEGWFCEVESAVKRWCGERNIPFYVTPCSSWWIHKEK